ncbi:hypothetical protein DPEC_G00137120 [Dallia pectoralis]|uniref:Uncharacterized protein n=1 Tax=Dallia pectoralis TaxID=75939 RepID=A0ACC2GLH3_DALPE|nr:hypothetical protein DPEC_G00137120 [Dallia pectoralis]
MLVKWKIPKSNVHVVLRDNASNMKKAMDEMDVPSLGCFAHTLQLVVHEGLLSQRSVSDALANAEVIPSFTVLKCLLARENEGDTGIQTMKTTLLEAVQKRFKTIENKALYSVATLLDPRFKDRYFTGADNIKHAKDALTREVEKMEA